MKAKPKIVATTRTMAEINAAFSSDQFEWVKRRRLVYVILLFCATVVGYLTVWGADTALQRDIANALTILAGTTSSSWIFGAVWDDLNARKWGTPTSPEAEVPATERTVSEE